MVAGSSRPVHKIPVSLWVEFEGVFPVIPDRRQVALYQQVPFRFIAAILQVRLTYVDGSGKIDPVVMSCLLRCGNGHMLDDQLAEVIQDQTGVYFLEDQFLFPAVEIYEADGVL